MTGILLAAYAATESITPQQTTDKFIGKDNKSATAAKRASKLS